MATLIDVLTLVLTAAILGCSILIIRYLRRADHARTAEMVETTYKINGPLCEVAAAMDKLRSGLTTSLGGR